MLSRQHIPLALLICCSTVLLPRAAVCGIGSDVSADASLDTAAPEVSITAGPLNNWYLPGEMINFGWSTNDYHPSDEANDYLARILTPAGQRDEFSFYPDTENYLWDWTVPEDAPGIYALEVFTGDSFGNTTSDTSVSFVILDSASNVPERPDAVHLAAPAPNPFNPHVDLSFALPGDADVAVSVFDVRGHRVRDLTRGRFPVGRHTVNWDGTTSAANRAPAGVYFFVLDAVGADFHERLTRKAVLLP